MKVEDPGQPTETLMRSVGKAALEFLGKEPATGSTLNAAMQRGVKECRDVHGYTATRTVLTQLKLDRFDRWI